MHGRLRVPCGIFMGEVPYILIFPFFLLDQGNKRRPDSASHRRPFTCLAGQVSHLHGIVTATGSNHIRWSWWGMAFRIR